MRRFVTMTFLVFFMLGIQPSVADLVECDMAKVVTGANTAEACLATVAINNIDGEKRVVPAQGFLIEPGVHTLNGRATLDMTQCPSIKADLQLRGSPGLEVNFEAGRTYYIAYDYESQDPNEWQLIIWKVDQPCSLYLSCLANEP